MEDEEKRMEWLLKDALRTEADKIIAEVEADESLKDIEFPSELDAALEAKIQKYKDKKKSP